MDLLDLGAHLDAQLGVEIGQRLVEQHQPRPQHQGTRDGDALLLAARQLARIPGFKPQQLHQAKHLLHALVDLLLRDRRQGEAECDVVVDRHVREQRVVLEYHAKATLLRRQVVHPFAVEPDLAFARRDQSRDDRQSGRLPAAARSEKGDELAFADFKLQVVQNGLVAVPLGDAKLQRGQLIARRLHMVGLAVGSAMELSRRKPSTRRASGFRRYYVFAYFFTWLAPISRSQRSIAKLSSLMPSGGETFHLVPT